MGPRASRMPMEAMRFPSGVMHAALNTPISDYIPETHLESRL